MNRRKLLPLAITSLALTMLGSCSSVTLKTSREAFLDAYQGFCNMRGSYDSYGLVTAKRASTDQSEVQGEYETMLVTDEFEDYMYANYNGNHQIPVSFLNRVTLETYIIDTIGLRDLQKEEYILATNENTIDLVGKFNLFEDVVTGELKVTFNDLGLLTYAYLSVTDVEGGYNVTYTFSNYLASEAIKGSGGKTDAQAFAEEYQKIINKRDNTKVASYREARISGAIKSDHDHNRFNDSYVNVHSLAHNYVLFLESTTMFGQVVGFSTSGNCLSYFSNNVREASFWKLGNKLAVHAIAAPTPDNFYDMIYCFNDEGMVCHTVVSGHANNEMFRMSYDIREYLAPTKKYANSNEFATKYVEYRKNKPDSISTEDYHEFTATVYSRELNATTGHYDLEMYGGSFLLNDDNLVEGCKSQYTAPIFASFLAEGNLPLILVNDVTNVQSLFNTLISSVYGGNELSTQLFCSTDNTLFALLKGPSATSDTQLVTIAISYDKYGRTKGFSYTLSNVDASGYESIVVCDNVYVSRYLVGTEIKTIEAATTLYGNRINLRDDTLPPTVVSFGYNDIYDNDYIKDVEYQGVTNKDNTLTLDDWDVNVPYGFKTKDKFNAWLKTVEGSSNFHMCMDGMFSGLNISYYDSDNKAYITLVYNIFGFLRNVNVETNGEGEEPNTVTTSYHFYDSNFH